MCACSCANSWPGQGMQAGDYYGACYCWLRHCISTAGLHGWLSPVCHYVPPTCHACHVTSPATPGTCSRTGSACHSPCQSWVSEASTQTVPPLPATSAPAEQLSLGRVICWPLHVVVTLAVRMDRDLHHIISAIKSVQWGWAAGELRRECCWCVCV